MDTRVVRDHEPPFQVWNKDHLGDVVLLFRSLPFSAPDEHSGDGGWIRLIFVTEAVVQ